MHFYTVTELADILKLSDKQVYGLIEDGLLKCHRFTRGKSGAIRVSQQQLDAFLQATQSEPARASVHPPPKPQTVILKHLHLPS